MTPRHRHRRPSHAVRAAKARETRIERAAHSLLNTAATGPDPLDQLDDVPCGYQPAPELHVSELHDLTAETLRLANGTVAGTVAGPAGTVTGDPEALIYLADHLVLIAATARYAQQLDDWNGTIEGLTP